MNKYTILLQSCLIFGFTSTANSQLCDDLCAWPKVYLEASVLNCSAYDTVLYDDFNDGNLDTSLWQTYFWNDEHPVSRLHDTCEEQIYLDANVVEENGLLKLVGKFEPGTTWTDTSGKIWTRDITSGMVMTKETFRFAKYEASINIPGAGWWPAFWMWNWDEIDIMENFWNDSQYLYNVLCQDDCKYTNFYNATLYDSLQYKFAVEWTPFTLTFYLDDVELPAKFYRFYGRDGSPLIVDCENTSIPAGEYYVNPAFPQTRSRGFSPILNLAVLPKYGKCACPYEGYDGPTCLDANSNKLDWGFPVDSTGAIIGDVPGVMEIDFVLVQEREFGICNSLMIYGDNCAETGNRKDPLSCASICVGDTGRLYLEDLNGENWLSELDVQNVSSSGDIQILHSNDYYISYVRNSIGVGEITIEYESQCGGDSTFKIQLDTVPTPDFGFIDINPCNGYAEIGAQETTCLAGDIDILSIKILDKWNNLHTTSYFRDEDLIDVDFEGVRFARHLIISYNISCQGGVVQSDTLDIEPCDECCPEGFEYDGANCYSGYSFSGVTGFIQNGSFYTTINCLLYANNACCPPGTTFNGTACFYKAVGKGFMGFIHNSAFYTEVNCDFYCCPEGFEYDGANCYSGYHYGTANGYVRNDSFFTAIDCQAFQGKDCCPTGTVKIGNECFFSQVPSGYQGFAQGNSFYVQPNCEVCCPDGSFFDGANCYFGIHFQSTAFFDASIGAFFAYPDCDLYGGTNCCPNGSFFDGSLCDFGIRLPPEYTGFVHNNSLYAYPVDCFEYYEGSRSPSMLEWPIQGFGPKNIREIEDVGKAKVYPNPFVDEFIVDISNIRANVDEIVIRSVGGRILKRVVVDDSEMVKIQDFDYSGVFLVNIIGNFGIDLVKVVSVN